MLTAQKIQNGLAQCYGTENYWKNEGILNFQYTDGVHTMWEMCEAYWLLIAISSYRRQEPFQVWSLVVDGSKAVLTMKEDSNSPVLVKQEIPYTDFPLEKMELWLIDGILILPSEY